MKYFRYLHAKTRGSTSHATTGPKIRKAATSSISRNYYAWPARHTALVAECCPDRKYNYTAWEHWVDGERQQPIPTTADPPIPERATWKGLCKICLEEEVSGGWVCYYCRKLRCTPVWTQCHIPLAAPAASTRQSQSIAQQLKERLLKVDWDSNRELQRNAAAYNIDAMHELLLGDRYAPRGLLPTHPHPRVCMQAALSSNRRVTGKALRRKMRSGSWALSFWSGWTRPSATAAARSTQRSTKSTRAARGSRTESQRPEGAGQSKGKDTCRTSRLHSFARTRGPWSGMARIHTSTFSAG